MTTRDFTYSLTLSLMVFLSLASSARASGDKTKERAARKACLSGSYREGVELLSDLFINTQDPVYIYNQARCYEQNGRYEEAINSFREYLRKAQNATAQERADAEKHVADCQALIEARQVGAAGAATTVRPETPPGISETSDESVTAPSPARASGRGLRIAGIACGAVGVGSIATAVYFYTRARSYSDKVSMQPVPNPSDESAGKNAETMQWVFYGVGGAALATGVVLYALGWPSNDVPARTAAIAPLLGPNVAGISMQGAF